MNTSVPYFGEALALLTAVVWGVAVIFFKKSGESVHPIALNLFKNSLAAVLFIPTMWVFGETVIRDVPINDYLILLLSGALGIGIADTLFFMSLNRLGAALSAIVDCLYSPFIIGLSVLWLGETLTIIQIIGVVMILSAVLTATIEKPTHTLSRRDLVVGILLGAAAMGVMAVGIVMAKPVLTRSPLIWASEIRMLGGMAVLLVVLVFHPERRVILTSMLGRRGRFYMIMGSLVGAYLAMILWLGGMKYAQASVASALNQTSNIFVFILAAFLLHEPITKHRVVGIVMAVAGVYLVTFFGA